MSFSIDYLWTPIVVFVVGYLVVRMAGKKSVVQMNSFDLIVIMIAGTALAEPITSKNNWIATWYTFVVVLCYMAFTRLTLINKLKKLLTNSPTVLIREGKIDEKGIKKVKLSVQYLLGQLRVQGYPNVNDVEMALMEESGQISIIPKSDKRALQPNDIQVSPSPAFVSIPLIIDGEIIDHNLRFIKKGRDWLVSQMQAYNMNMNDLEDITLATYNQQGFVEFDTSHQRGDYWNEPDNYTPGNEN